MISGIPRFNALEVTSLRVEWTSSGDAPGLDVSGTAAYLRQQAEGRPINHGSVSSSGPWSERTLEALYQLKRSMEIDFAADQLDAPSADDRASEREPEREPEGIGEHLGAAVDAESI